MDEEPKMESAKIGDVEEPPMKKRACENKEIEEDEEEYVRVRLEETEEPIYFIQGEDGPGRSLTPLSKLLGVDTILMPKSKWLEYEKDVKEMEEAFRKLMELNPTEEMRKELEKGMQEALLKEFLNRKRVIKEVKKTVQLLIADRKICELESEKVEQSNHFFLQKEKNMEQSEVIQKQKEKIAALENSLFRARDAVRQGI